MTMVNVYNDGKLGRGIKGEILRRDGKRILIKFHDSFSDMTLEGWFVRVRRERGGAYCHDATNSWFYPFRETEKFKVESKEWLTPEYHNKLFGE